MVGLDLAIVLAGCTVLRDVGRQLAPQRRGCCRLRPWCCASFPKNAGRNTGFILLALSLGGALLPLIIAPLIGRLGWRTAMGLSGLAVIVVIVPLSWIFLDGHNTPKSDVDTPEPANLQSALTTAQILARGDLWKILAGFPAADIRECRPPAEHRCDRNGFREFSRASRPLRTSYRFLLFRRQVPVALSSDHWPIVWT